MYRPACNLMAFSFYPSRLRTLQRASILIRLAAIIAMFCGAGVAPVSASPPAGYYLVWGDEFNGTSLDTNKWTYWLTGSHRDAINITNAISVGGGNMTITTFSAGGTNYAGMIASQYHFHPRYGYYEANIQWGDTNGMWSAFWLRSPTMGTFLNDIYDSGGELDACEHRYVGIFGTYIANIVSDNIHWNGYGTGEGSSGSPNVGSGLDSGFHTYGLLWNGPTYLFSIDNSQVWDGSSTTPVFGSDAYVILSSEVDDTSTTWAGYIPTNGYPSQAQSNVKMTVDYFRYYAPTNVLFWTGASSAFLTNSLNWVSNMPPLANSDLTFSYLTQNFQTSLGGNLTVDGLIVLEMPSALAIGGGNLLTIGPGGIDMVAANQNFTINAPLNLAANQIWFLGRNNPGNLMTVNGNIAGASTLTKAGYGTLVLNGINSFSGVLNLDTASSITNDGAVRIVNSAAVANVASPIFIRNTGTGVSTLQLSNSAGSVTVPQNISLAGRNTNVAAIENLSGSNTLGGGVTLTAGDSVYMLQSDTGILNLGGTISAGNALTGACTLTFQGIGNFLISGSIQNGSASAFNVSVMGPGSLILPGANAYTGTTTVSGGSLAGNGSVSGAAIIQSGGTIAPGTTNTLGTLSFGNNLTLAPGSTTFLRINKASQTNDLLQVSGVLTYGGTLVVTNLAGTLVSGDSFKLFNAGSYSGSFNALILPPLVGLGWNTNGLTNGILSVGPAPPQITADLPPQVTRVSGQSFTYSIAVSGTPPFSYQWYGNSTLIPGQTNSSFSLTAGSPGTYTFYVVITNGYGATTSSASTMAVSAWPPTAYAAAVRSNNPAGYWPLQETIAPAAATVETNLGSLGPIANAYYPNTNSPDITLGTPGALAGDTDTAATFNTQDQNYAFVPRAAPALTLQPPFTLEAWFNPQSSTYGVILGEGGGAALNGGTTYGGFQFGWAGGNQTRFELQLYKHGINSFSAVDTPAGYSVGTWYHYVATYDTASNATIYINGVQAATAVLAYVADSWSPLTIGNGKWNGLSAQRGVSGVIDEVAVYTNLLAPSRITAHYSAGTNQAPAIPYKQAVLNDNPLVYYRMDSPAYVTPGSTASPVAMNYGSAPVNGAYLSGTVPAGVSGPALSGMGPNPVAAPINGIFSCIDAGHDPAFNPTNNQPFTILLWFKGNPADSSMQALMSHGAASWSLDLNGTTGKLVWNSGAGSVTSVNIYNDGAWHQAAGVYTGSQNYPVCGRSVIGFERGQWLDRRQHQSCLYWRRPRLHHCGRQRALLWRGDRASRIVCQCPYARADPGNLSGGRHAAASGTQHPGPERQSTSIELELRHPAGFHECERPLPGHNQYKLARYDTDDQLLGVLSRPEGLGFPE